ncbi:MAG: hypothetical protein ACK4YU_14290, partial [Paracoccus sp. (in: a-proteobacteria)]
MTKPITMNMAKITELMRSGQLSEATQLIQSGLGGGGLPEMPTGGVTGGMTLPKGFPTGLPAGLPTGLPAGLAAGLNSGRSNAPVDVPPGASWTTRQHQAAGLSAGGAMAVILGAVFADDFGAVACHSGLPNGAASDMAGAFAAMSQGGSDRGQGVGCRLFVLHGS